jgi:hypothetical protein
LWGPAVECGHIASGTGLDISMDRSVVPTHNITALAIPTAACTAPKTPTLKASAIRCCQIDDKIDRTSGSYLLAARGLLGGDLLGFAFGQTAPKRVHNVDHLSLIRLGFWLGKWLSVPFCSDQFPNG